jgi:ADP-ribose pyrophosphatase
MAGQSWKVVKTKQIVDNPYTQVFMQSIELPDGRLIENWPIIQTLDYVNALVISDDNEAMILEGYKHGLGRSSWQVLGGYLEPDEEPLAAVKRELLEETGYASEHWKHLGSYVVDANRRVGEGHFFLARNARKVTEPSHDDLEYFDLRWVSLDTLKVALRDGRVGVLSYAINISLALNFLQL